jgi:hypothetical protein
MAGSVGAVVKASYSRGAVAALRLAKGHVRYAVHRCNEHGQRQYREIWDSEGGLGKQAAYARLDRVQPDDYVYRLMLSPNPEHQDAGGQLDLRRWTQQMMAQLDQELGRGVEWFAVSHDNPDHRHVHVVAVTQRRLDVGQFRSMRAAGDRDAAQQRERAPARDGRKQEASNAAPRRGRERDTLERLTQARPTLQRDLSRGLGR